MAGCSSSRLKQKKEVILSLWEARSLKEIPSAGTAVSLALRDSLPLYLDHLSDALDSNRKMDFKSVVSHEEKAARIGELHGADRATNPSYVLTEVIFEYHILREVIFQVLETDGPLGETQRDIVLDSIEQAVNDAAVMFSQVHADVQQKFINTLTHDLKNPIAAAKTNAQLILRNPSDGNAIVTSATRIVRSLNRLDSMIHDLLDASRIRAGEELLIQFHQCDLDRVVRDVVAEMSQVHGERFVLKSEGPVEGYWGGDELRRVVENLAGNAVKYSTPESPITVALRRDKTAVVLAVHNEGQPIPESEIPFLFQQYRRSKSAQETSNTGWGLGLTLVKGVVNAHKGKVRVESAAGKGTAFIIEIPFTEVPAALAVLDKGMGA